MKEKQNAALGTAPLGRLMLKFALPCTVSLLVGALYNLSLIHISEPTRP